MNIIVRKEATHAIFKPHWNSSMQKKYYTRDEYLGDMKKYGLEPYREIKKAPSKPYVMSEEGKEMCRQAAKYEKRKQNPESRFIKSLNDLGIAEKPKWLRDAEDLTRGGFHSEEEA